MNRLTVLQTSLKSNNITPGTCVALYLPNIPAFMICYLATVRIGAIAVSINSMYKSEEVKYIVNDANCGLIFTTGDLVANILLDECPALKQILICEGDPQAYPTLDDWLAKSSNQSAVDRHASG